MEFTDREKDRVENLINFTASQSGLIFFSEQNIDNLNTQIKKYVLKMTKEKYGEKIMINSQKKTLMLSVMRYVYLQHNQTHYVLDFGLAEERVKALNKIFLNLVIPTVIQSLIGYIKYLNDFNAMGNLNILERPISTNNKRGITKESIYF
jgi:hypothetical protein